MIKMLVCDFDGTINGGSSLGVDQFSAYLNTQPDLQFIIATGRTLPSIKEGLTMHNYPKPQCIISDIGTHINYDYDLIADEYWQRQLQARWNKSEVQAALRDITFLGECNASHQGDYKITFEGKLDHKQYSAISMALAQQSIDVDITYSHDWFLDITPKGINKASAIHYIMQKYNLTAKEICVAGDSANDTTMLTMPGINAILVANHYHEVAHLSALNHVYTSNASHAEGVLEGLIYWQDIATKNSICK
ncbi:HAD-IIB family hydrolase [Aliivibrio sp. 1S128]|uniref:HAD-IIB family hydrolase n=1 Tax=Aliivibrio sp. 1S128 TaxID=1840085 RepID=UPI00080DA04E|nr:HAD-IIB family hydrolase [Aliivibrio sp. 1S128]OCH19689.1 sucrose-phosphate synthase [Aliivibrio sp. 1S128]